MASRRTPPHLDATYRASLHRQIAEAAVGVLGGSVSVTDAARKLTFIAHELGIWSEDPFRLFVGIDSETDVYPRCEVRARWNPDKLAVLDSELALYEDKVRPDVIAACKMLAETCGAPAV